MKYYREVIDNIISPDRVLKNRPWRNVSFGVNATDETYRQYNLYPEVVIEPVYNPLTHKLVGPVEVFEDNQVKITWSVVELSLDEITQKKDARKIELAQLRYQKECQGVMVGGLRVVTDRISQAMLTGAYVACLQNPARKINWKGENKWALLDAAQITALAVVVADHIQACFDREKELSEALDLDVTTDITIGWPG